MPCEQHSAAATVRTCCCPQAEATALGTTNMSVNSSGSSLGSAPYTKNLMRLLNRCASMSACMPAMRAVLIWSCMCQDSH